MPITGLIPASKTPEDSFFGGAKDTQSIIESILNSRYKQQEANRLGQLAPYEIALKRAEAQKAEQATQESKLFSNLLNNQMNDSDTNMGYAGNEQKNNVSPAPTNKMNAQTALMLSGRFKLPTQVVEGKLITPFGNFDVGETPKEKRLGTAESEAAGQTLKKTSETSLSGLSLNASFQALDELMKNPRYENIAGTMEGKLINAQPLGLPLGAMLQKRLPSQFSKEDAELHGTASAHLGNVVTGVAQKFKGPYRNFVNGIINNMKPNMGDSKAVQQGKLRALRELNDIADEQNEMIAKDISNGMEPTAAILKAAKKITPTYIQKRVNEARQKESIEKNEFKVKAPNGMVIKLPTEEQANALIKDHPDHVRLK